MRPNTIALGLLAAVIALGLYALWAGSEGPQPSALRPGLPLMSAERPIPPPPPGVAVRPPNFDLLRIDPDGKGVAQGRSEPLARISLRAETGADLGAGQADERGEWVIMTRAPLAPGDHLLGLIAEMPDGSGVASAEEAVVSLAAKPAGRPLVVLMRPGEASLVLQRPEGPETRPLCLEAVDEEAGGTLHLGGRGDPGRLLYVYAGGRFLAQTNVDDEGHWVLSLPRGVLGPGAHRIRLDILNETGRVARRFEAPFERLATGTGKPEAEGARPPVAVGAEEGGWRILREQGHAAMRQTVVYGASAGAPRDPAPFLAGQVPAATAAGPPSGIVPAADR